jgi:hypothetical protein
MQTLTRATVAVPALGAPRVRQVAGRLWETEMGPRGSGRRSDSAAAVGPRASDDGELSDRLFLADLSHTGPRADRVRAGTRNAQRSTLEEMARGTFSWAGKILFEEADRGVSLTSLWNNDWEFVVMDEDEADHPGGLGDFVAMIGLIAATKERAHDILRSRFGDAAEVLRG